MSTGELALSSKPATSHRQPVYQFVSSAADCDASWSLSGPHT